MGFLFQDAALFDWMTVAGNVGFPLRRHTNKTDSEIAETVREKLAQVGLETDGDKMPSELSGGMRKRAGIARALVLDPKILLIDEPDSGLDRITAAGIDHLLADLNRRQHKTLIVVTHDPMGARRYSQRMAVLDQGKLAAMGTAEELEGSPNPIVRRLVSIEVD
jgi:phospholipid/cholesterol/gamma-HCH transport system ATP-binding protein